MAATLLLAVLIVWLGGDFTYSRVIDYRLNKREAAIRRDDDGVRQGCHAYTVGEADTALLMIHGFADSPAMFRNMASSLADRGFACRAMRLPGFAEPMEQYALSNRDAWTDAVREELRILRSTHSSVVVVAHSLGATIVIDHLLKHPHDADGVVLICPLIEVSRRRSPVLSPEQWYRLAASIALFTDVVESRFQPDVHASPPEDYPGSNPFVPVPLYGELFALLREVHDRRAEFRVPMLMVLSRDDKVTDPCAAEFFFHESSSIVKRIHYVEEAGHVVPLESGWEDVVVEVERFVNIVANPPSPPGRLPTHALELDPSDEAEVVLR
ncbi:alpha/beta hydrolase [Verrucomicrobiota bacterium]